MKYKDCVLLGERQSPQLGNVKLMTGSTYTPGSVSQSNLQTVTGAPGLTKRLPKRYPAKSG